MTGCTLESVEGIEIKQESVQIENEADVSTEAQQPINPVEVRMLDVGQADSIFIDILGTDIEILIDAGNRYDGDEIIEYIDPFVQGELDYMILTHGHADHIGGAVELLNKYQIKNIIWSGYVHDSATYGKTSSARNAEGAQQREDQDEIIQLAPGIILEIIESGDSFGDDINDYSVIVKLSVGEIDLLFTGDMESAAEANILDRDIDAEILKVAHHCSGTSSSSEFLDRVTPEVALISVGQKNTYGHPDPNTLQRLSEYTNQIYMTKDSGNIVVWTDGVDYRVNGDKQ